MSCLEVVMFEFSHLGALLAHRYIAIRGGVTQTPLKRLVRQARQSQARKSGEKSGRVG